MRIEVTNAIRLIQSGDPVNVEMALNALAPLKKHIFDHSIIGANSEIEAILHSIMWQAFVKYFRPFGIEISQSSGRYGFLRLHSRIGTLQYETTKHDMLYAMLSNPNKWKHIVAIEVRAVLQHFMTDPMNNNDWKP